MMDLLTESNAVISDCGTYRYWLMRKWGKGPVCTFIMLNPSTADASQDDPTIRRCIAFARREKCDAIAVVNLFAYRATKPDELLTADDPVGPKNDATIRDAVRTALRHDWPLIAAWGSHKAAKSRAPKIAKLAPMKCLKKSKTGAPWHPLYVKGDAPLIDL